ncbi:hypothetical protein SAMN05216227_10205 [Pseudorhodobacter antarcticus]|uniref:Uncharacterized protein n=2 Tax=Pseudorhodobacter antarcticus TaxID=1077947 RepID=A0A1H8IE24_9RHOB|nr:hypothetical protein SAMN05216227_10205 [Pseudorhodobacter antarcticus]
MMMARRLNHVENIAQQDSAERALNKLARTYATQMEALKRYRTGGQQKVTVEHVTVNAGEQAIVGAVPHGGRVVMKSDTNPIHKAHSAPRCAHSTEVGQLFHAIVGTRSTASWAVIPRQVGQVV